jgi:hypothetical protein
MTSYNSAIIRYTDCTIGSAVLLKKRSVHIPARNPVRQKHSMHRKAIKWFQARATVPYRGHHAKLAASSLSSGAFFPKGFVDFSHTPGRDKGVSGEGTSATK